MHIQNLYIMHYYTTHTRIFLHAVVLGRMPISITLFTAMYMHLAVIIRHIAKPDDRERPAHL